MRAELLSGLRRFGRFTLAALMVVGPVREAAAGFSPADSAAVARAVWKEAREARARGDHLGAMLKAERAHDAWPMQWYYAYGLATLAAEAGEPTTAARALTDLAAIGAAPDLSTDSTLQSMRRESSAVETAFARLDAIRLPLARSSTFAMFDSADSAFWPEGLARDARTGRLFVASVRQRRIAVVAPGRAPHDLVPARGGGLRAVLALAVDPARGRLWATSAGLPQMEGYSAADTGQASIHLFDLATGAPIARHDLPRTPEGHVPGDVCVAPNGDVYVTDSQHPAIYRVRAGARRDSAPEEWLTDPAFRSLQGQAFAADGRTLFVADYSHGIAAVDVATRRVRWLEPPPGVCTLGIDGMARAGGDLVCVQNGISPPRVVRLTLGAGPLPGREPRITGLEVLDRNLALADEPTMLVVDGSRAIYVANSQWEKYDDAGVRKGVAPLTAPRLLAVPLRDAR